MSRTQIKRGTTTLRRSRIVKRGPTDTEKADATFSRLIREQARWRCVRCHVDFSERTSELHCSHFFNRDRYATRYDRRNADALCMRCHLWGVNPWEHAKNPGDAYHAFMLDKLGEAELEELRLLSESRCKLVDAKARFLDGLAAQGFMIA